MESKYVLITGISSGIGRATAQSLINKGYYVIGTVRSSKDQLDAEIEMGPNLKVFICDVLKNEDLIKLKQQLHDYLADAKLTALINNAGIAIPGPMELLDDDKFDMQMQVNVMAVRKVTNIALQFMYKNHESLHSKIIFISSISGLFASPFNGPYCISKHAIECMVDIYRRELMLYDIDVISILPGPIQSKIWSKTSGTLKEYEDSPYGFIAKKADKIIESTEKNAQDVSLVTNRILKVLSDRKPKTGYIIHKNRLGLLLLAKVLPKRFVDKLIWKTLNKTNSDKYRPV